MVLKPAKKINSCLLGVGGGGNKSKTQIPSLLENKTSHSVDHNLMSHFLLNPSLLSAPPPPGRLCIASSGTADPSSRVPTELED